MFQKNAHENVEYWTGCPGIGSIRARRIIAMKPWKQEKIDWDAVAKIKGVGKTTLESLRKCLYDPPSKKS